MEKLSTKQWFHLCLIFKTETLRTVDGAVLNHRSEQLKFRKLKCSFDVAVRVAVIPCLCTYLKV